MLTAPPLEVAPVMVKAPAAVSAAGPGGKEKLLVLSITTGLPTMLGVSVSPTFFFFNDTATTEIYTLSLHDALPISTAVGSVVSLRMGASLVPVMVKVTFW